MEIYGYAPAVKSVSGAALVRIAHRGLHPWCAAGGETSMPHLPGLERAAIEESRREMVGERVSLRVSSARNDIGVRKGNRNWMPVTVFHPVESWNVENALFTPVASSPPQLRKSWREFTTKPLSSAGTISD